MTIGPEAVPLQPVYLCTNQPQAQAIGHWYSSMRQVKMCEKTCEHLVAGHQWLW